MKRKKLFIFLLLIGLLSLLPFLGLTDFNTKGEPREAVVSYSMLESGNWILPVNNGGDIAFKPPFFHWCVAAVSAVAGGVTEYTSRFPSAVALIVMMGATSLFYAKRRGREVALATALLLMSNFEVHRAAMNCRVDMVLTLFIVLSLFLLYRWAERGTKGFPWLATICMGCATLTKGPVGILLPCLVTGVYLWIREGKFLSVAGRMAAVALVSCALPALWYVAAYLQGGDEFVSLVMEENLGRFTGSMSYESHENPVYYNIFSLLAGLAPYTLLLLLSLFSLKRLGCEGKRCDDEPTSGFISRLKTLWHSLKSWIKGMDSVRLFTLLSATVIFIFYCIPKSKRSVYLLPVYPFVAYFIAEYILHIAKRAPHLLRLFAGILAGVASLLAVALVAIKAGWVPDGIFHGRHAADNQAYLEALRGIPCTLWNVMLMLLPLLIGFPLVAKFKRFKPENAVYATLLLTVAIFMAMDGVVQPAILNVKSDKPMAEELRQRVPQGELYQYNSEDMMRYFSVNFYLGDSVPLFEKGMPQSGYLLAGSDDLELLKVKYPQYRFVEAWNPQRRSCDTRRDVHLYHFER